MRPSTEAARSRRGAALKLGDQSLGAGRRQPGQELLGAVGDRLALVHQGGEQPVHDLIGHVGVLLGVDQRADQGEIGVAERRLSFGAEQRAGHRARRAGRPADEQGLNHQPARLSLRRQPVESFDQVVGLAARMKHADGRHPDRFRRIAKRVRQRRVGGRRPERADGQDGLLADRGARVGELGGAVSVAGGLGEGAHVHAARQRPHVRLAYAEKSHV